MTGLGTVRWGQRPLGFELRSSDAHVLARASLVFRPWQSPASQGPACVWRVDRVEASAARGWRITGSSGAEPLTRASITDAVRSVEFLAVQSLLDCPSTRTLHGALVVRNGRGVVLLGRAESGKSTLACALWQRGWRLLGDDIAILDAAGSVAWPAPRRVALRAPSRALLGAGLWSRLLATPSGEPTSEGCLFHPDEVDGCAREGAVTLAALIFLDRPASRRGPATRLEPAHALLALLPYTNLSLRMDAGAVICRLQPLAELVPAWDLARGPLDGMIAAVEDVFDRGLR